MSSDWRQWVQEHNNGHWHWYGSGQFAAAACGKPPIPGTPLVSEHGPSGLVCQECARLFDKRPIKPEPPAPDFADWDLPRLAFEYRNCHFTQTAELNALAKEIERREKPMATKPGLPTEPGTYRLQFKGGYEIILRTDGTGWYFLTGTECTAPRDVKCHAPIEPLVAPEEPKPVSLVERLRMSACHAVICDEAADEIERLTKERDRLREWLIVAKERLLLHHKRASEFVSSTWIIDQIDAALTKEKTE